MNKVPWGQPESRGERNTCSNNYDPARELINHKMERGKGKKKSMACFSKEGAETGRRWLGDSRGKENGIWISIQNRSLRACTTQEDSTSLGTLTGTLKDINLEASSHRLGTGDQLSILTACCPCSPHSAHTHLYLNR